MDLTGLDEVAILNGFQNMMIELVDAIKDPDGFPKASLLVLSLRETIRLCPDELIVDLTEHYNSALESYNAWFVSLEHGMIVDLLHTGPQGTLWFETKLIKDDEVENMSASTFKLHFQGWRPKYDEIHDISKYIVLPRYSIKEITKRGPRPKSKTDEKIDEMNTSIYAEEIDIVSASSENPENTIELPKIVTNSGRIVKSLNRGQPESSSSNTDKKRKSTLISEFDGRETGDRHEWLCTVCGQLEGKDGSDLTLCDGGCLRVWHYNCFDPSWEKPVVSNACKYYDFDSIFDYYISLISFSYY